MVGVDKHRINDVDTHKKDPEFIDPHVRIEPLKDRFFFDYLIARAGGETTKAKVEAYQDDIREDPVIPNRK